MVSIQMLNRSKNKILAGLRTVSTAKLAAVISQAIMRLSRSTNVEESRGAVVFEEKELGEIEANFSIADTDTDPCRRNT